MEIRAFSAKVHSAEAVPMVIKFLEQWDFGEGGADVTIEPVSNRLDYLAVFWIWMRQFAEEFSKRGGEEYTAEKMHDLMCYKFLGHTEPQLIGRTEIPSTLVTLTHPKKIKGAQFGEFLRNIEVWAVDVGVHLKTIRDSEYMEYKEAC